jgi:hypothetical protein
MALQNRTKHMGKAEAFGYCKVMYEDKLLSYTT